MRCLHCFTLHDISHNVYTMLPPCTRLLTCASAPNNHFRRLDISYEVKSKFETLAMLDQPRRFLTVVRQASVPARSGVNTSNVVLKLQHRSHPRSRGVTTCAGEAQRCILLQEQVCVGRRPRVWLLSATQHGAPKYSGQLTAAMSAPDCG